MGDDSETIIVEVPPTVTDVAPPTPSAGEMWHAEHEARHAEHMQHLETIREEHRSEINRIEQRLSEVEGRVAAAEASGSESHTMAEALDTVATVGEVIAEVTDAVTPDVEAQTPESSASIEHGTPGPDGEVQPDVGGGDGSQSGPTAPPANNRRRGRLW